MKKMLMVTAVTLAAAFAAAPAPAQNAGSATINSAVPDPSTLPAMKNRLGIHIEQETEWKAYAAAVDDAWKARQQGGPVPDELRSARNRLAEVLLPEQRAEFDQQTAELPPAH